ncbi:hypothetical protein POJ06DRAFT_252187 [Lipomyces tetrasporus]|uniref:Uncharacterized protein n=1 Tax=Lipomyces tetrasporus TaxID=54092 RepID=A0AAD7QS42_9ASCO|nr:uncharacterized protein POJ06DRAFT_252187 [Lipomyces tetrasporus]KAJ8100261.1 hypothetical protein POJ06DRAFT_252187 [Lipomyces tetrasporus]
MIGIKPVITFYTASVTMATPNNDYSLVLIPPTVSLNFIQPPPPPSNPPTKDDVHRALSYKQLVHSSLSYAPGFRATRDDLEKINDYCIRVRQQYEQTNGPCVITLDDAVLEFRQLFRELDDKVAREFNQIYCRFNQLDGRINHLDDKIDQLEGTIGQVNENINQLYENIREVYDNSD